jgi:hypothetical protein
MVPELVKLLMPVAWIVRPRDQIMPELLKVPMVFASIPEPNW